MVYRLFGRALAVTLSLGRFRHDWETHPVSIAEHRASQHALPATCHWPRTVTEPTPTLPPASDAEMARLVASEQLRMIYAHSTVGTLIATVFALFLASYLTYHFHVGSVPYRGGGFTRPLYFTILISHTILAAAVVPLALVTVARAARRRFDRHVAIARYTLPVWLYVSVTGVVIYLMLYGPPGSRPAP